MTLPPQTHNEPTTVRPDPGPGPQPSRKSVRLFGEFLVDEGAVSEDDLEEALALMAATNSTVGELAVQRGFLTAADADRINALQRRIDGRWGDIALTLGIGHLTPDRIDDLRFEQDARNLRLSDALVELGCVSASTLDDHWRQFEADQPGGAGAPELGPVYGRCASACEIVDALPRLAGRVLRTPLRLAAPTRWTAVGALEVHVTVVLFAADGLAVGLSTTAQFADAVARRLAAKPYYAPEHALPDASDPQRLVRLGQFATMLAEVAKRRMDADLDPACEAVRIGSPIYNELPARGIACEVASGLGRGLLVLERAGALATA